MIRVTPTEFDAAVEAAVREVPEEFRPYLENVIIEVQDVPSREILDEGWDDDILGIYIGNPLEEQYGDGYNAALPGRIIIYRKNLCEMCESYDELIEEIRITVLHEIGHHFGLDEDRLDELGYA
jgi:predicted Zn-dependent protease with MMP-like domain